MSTLVKLEQLKSFTKFGTVTVGDIIDKYISNDRDLGWKLLIDQIGICNNLSPVAVAAILQSRKNEFAKFIINHHDKWLYDTDLLLDKEGLRIHLLWHVEE